jgi:trehalose 6-phosphate synthase
MPLAERKERYATNMAALRKFDLGAWRDRFLTDLRDLRDLRDGKNR